MNKFENFTQVKTYIDSLPKPPYEGKGQPHDIGEFHDDHRLTTSQQPLMRDGRFEIYQMWNYCPECKKVRNSKVIGLDNKTNRAHVRYFIKHGESATTGILRSFTTPLKSLRGGEF